METTYNTITDWTPQVGDTFTLTSDRPWHVGNQTGTHVVVTRMTVTEVTDHVMRYKRSVVLSESGTPPLDQVWPGPEAGTVTLAAVQLYLSDGQISDVTHGNT